MSTIGGRLKEERARLAKSQTELASIGGVGKTTQINYEKDLRSPDSSYLAALAVAGVDVMYVLTGQRSISETSLAPGEAALLENYRRTSPERRASLDEVSKAFASVPSDDQKKDETG